MTSSDRSWARKSLDDAAYAALARTLPPSALWSVLLAVLEERARQRPRAAVLRQWESDRFVRVAAADQRTLNELDRHLLAAAAAFEAIELSPLAPLGACSAVALASQNRIVSTTRGTEVVSDPTGILALESARRLRRDSRQVVRLATSHRCVRAQPVPQGRGFAAHFRLFCLSSAGRERQDHGFLVEAACEHVRTHLGAMALLEQHGYRFPPRRVVLLASPAKRSLAARIAAQLAGIEVSQGTLDHPYYDGLRFMVQVGTAADGEIPFVDGGSFGWVRALTSNDRLAFVASGMGSQLAAVLFREPRPA